MTRLEITEKVYRELVSYASHLARGRPDFDGRDFVGDVLLEFLGKDNFDILSIKKRIQFICLEKRLNDRKESGQVQFSVFETDRFCKKCKEVKPIVLFYMYTRKKYLTQVIHNVCKECSSKIRNEWYKRKRKEEPGRFKENQLKAVHKWRAANKSKYQKYQKDRDIREIAELADNYIKKILRGKYSRTFLDENPQIIIEARERILEKRKKREAKK